MRALTNAEILDVWERGSLGLPPQRAVLLLATACPDHEPRALAAYSIGQRDAALLQLRALMFGPKVVSLTPCPQCAESVELEFSTDDFTSPLLPAVTAGVHALTEQEYEVQFRLPDSTDQMAIAHLHDGADARQTLLARCLVSFARAGNEVSVTHLPANVLARLTKKMAELDPLASIFLAVTCASCGHCWQVLFDVGDFFWREVSYHAQRLLHEVHQLASAYGWSEAAILSLGTTRRRLYLEMCSR